MNELQNDSQQQGYMKAITDRQSQQRNADAAARNNAKLRQVMVQLVGDIGRLMDAAAQELADTQHPEFQAFDVDDSRDVIAWQLAEFATLGKIDRDDEMYEYTPRGHQWREPYAASWFKAQETVTTAPPAKPTTYPGITDEWPRKIDERYITWAGQKPRVRYEVGEGFIAMLPALRVLLTDTAQTIITQSGNFDDTPMSRDLIVERLMFDLACLLTGEAVDRENVARWHWLADDYARAILTYPLALATSG